MSIKKESALKDVTHDFEVYSNLILVQLKLLQNIIKSGALAISEDVYKQIKKNEKLIDKFEVRISEKIINTIVLYNPVASELRQLMACYRMSGKLERIGDLILNVVRFIRKIKDNKLYTGFANALGNTIFSINSMVEQAILSFINEDITIAIHIIKNDKIVDELHQSFNKKVIKKANLSDQPQIKLLSFLNMKSIVINIERIADNATDIAEATVYSLEGKDIRHKKIKSIDKEIDTAT